MTCTTTKLTLFAISKAKWHIKQDTGKSIKNALCVLQYAKRAEGRKIKLVAYQLLSFAGLKVSGSQLVS